MSSGSKPTRRINLSISTVNTCDLLKRRELGLKRGSCFDEKFYVKLYKRIDQYKVKIPGTSKGTRVSNGGIFNLEFSSDGRLLVAACEQKSVLIYDAANQAKLKTVEQAHDKCVNCIRFLNDRTFATCSDDNSIKLWDIRWLKKCQKTLHGHANWVKNIEYSEADNIMVTSAFDGSIYAWDLKSPTENGMLYDKVLLMNGLMRTKLSPDGTKMVISTTNGFMIIIHDLNLLTLGNDLRSFRPNLYRLMQMSDQNFPAGTMFNYLFHPSRKRNRVEFIDDFPNEAEVISSLQIHPHGWTALSRNVNAEDKEEWTSVHDIQKRDASEYENAYIIIEEDTEPYDSADEFIQNSRPTDLWMGTITNEIYHLGRPSDTYENILPPTMGIINSGLIGMNAYDSYFQEHPEQRNKVLRNLPRLTHYVKEKNVGKGYIKELCFSSDGRVVCSPYDKGIRLLGFDRKIQELTYCVPDRPQQLVTLIEMNNYHRDVVVSCKFSPVHMQMVSGCLAGDIVWYKPVL